MFTAMNNDKILCGCFGFYPSFVVGNPNTARGIHFFVLCNEELNCENYIENVLVKNSAMFVTSQMQELFQISFQGDTVFITIEARLYPNLPSEIIFAQSVLEK